MANQAPPKPATQTDSGDAFSAIARKLDNLLEARQARESIGLSPDLQSDDPPAPRRAMVDPPPAFAQAAQALDNIANVEPTAPQDTGDEEADLLAAVANIDAILSQDVEPSPTDSDPATAEATGDTSDDPAELDLDAELEALLAEQPIDAEVLNAAQDIAKQDAEEAERNQDALRQRAQEAASALEEPIATQTPTPSVATDDPAEDTADDDMDLDAITAEINNILEAENDEPEETSEEESPEPEAEPEKDPTIDQIDQMLAAEAEDDSAMDGAFFSADDVVAGNLTAPDSASVDDELEGSFEATQDVAADEKTDTDTESEAESLEDMPRHRALLLKLRGIALPIASQLALRGCWGLNWPARRFLTREWRATLGYVALLQAVGAMAVWLYLIVA